MSTIFESQRLHSELSFDFPTFGNESDVIEVSANDHPRLFRIPDLHEHESN